MDVQPVVNFSEHVPTTASKLINDKESTGNSIVSDENHLKTQQKVVKMVITDADATNSSSHDYNDDEHNQEMFVVIAGKRFWLGAYDTPEEATYDKPEEAAAVYAPEEAVVVYDKAAVQFNESDAITNFPYTGQSQTTVKSNTGVSCGECGQRVRRSPKKDHQSVSPVTNAGAARRQPCAACKHRRTKCKEDCFLRAFFPADKNTEFQAVQRVFGVSNIQKLLKSLATVDERQNAIESLVWEAQCRQTNPVMGSYGEFLKVGHELAKLQAQLHGVSDKSNMSKD